MRIMRRWGWLMGIAVWLAAAPAWSATAPAPAGQDRVDDMLTRYNFHPAFHKLGRGLANGLFGWLEIPLNVGQRMSSGDTGGSFFTGLAYGLTKGVARTAVGVYETATFWLPYPEEFAPILPTLEYFKKSGRRRPLPFE
jgi:putative exosortase-associated protein (TIGR04073 family)